MVINITVNIDVELDLLGDPTGEDAVNRFTMTVRRKVFEIHCYDLLSLCSTFLNTC